MDIGHSRLLKFLVASDKTNMSTKHNLKIEVLNPTDVESEVPRQQTLRSPCNYGGNPPQYEHNNDEVPMDTHVSEEQLTLKQGDTIETYSPVITVKTVESNFGKDGLRFQRLTVTEDVSVNYQHLFKKETKGKTVVTQDVPTPQDGMKNLLNPVFVGESANPAERFWSPRQDPVGDPEGNTFPEERKVKTRIPVSRFKPAVAKVQRERKKSEEANEEKSKREAPEKPPRRSSIPKLTDKILAARKSAFKSDVNDQATVKSKAEEPVKTIENRGTNEKKPARVDRIPVLRRDLNRARDNNDKTKLTKANSNEDQIAQNINEEKPVAKHENEELDDEFDKLYEEIVDIEAESAESVPIEMLDIKIKDPAKLDIKFEEIVHQYDDDTIEQVKVEPMDKAKYRKIPLLKRRSEQEIKMPKQYVRQSSLKTNSNVSKITKQGGEEVGNNKDSNKNETIDKTGNSDFIDENVQRDLSIKINNNNDIDVYLAQSQSPIQMPAYNVNATPDTELVKVGLSNFGNLNRNFEDPIDANVTPEPGTVRTSVLDPPDRIKVRSSEINKDIKPEEAKYIEYAVEEPILINDTQYIDRVYMVENPEVADITYDSTTIDDAFVIQDNSERQKTKENNQYDPTREEITHLETPIQINLSHKDIIVPTTSAESKYIPLLTNNTNTNYVVEKKQSRYDNKPFNDETFNKNITEESSTDKDKVNRILKRLTSQEKSNDETIQNNKNDEHVELNKDAVSSKVNVRKIINRITSHEIDDDAKKELHDLPKKRSVLSKIALFEQAAPEPASPKKLTHTYAKLQRTVSEEVRHSPKIVHEVLKPSIIKQTETPYQVINIDILQPVEIINKNEEQVLLVENLKEETIEYENLDEAKAEEPFSDINEPCSLICTENNEIISTNNGGVDHAHDKSEEFTEEQFKNHKYTGNDNKRQEEDLKKRDDLNYIPVKEKIHRLKSHENTNIRRAKSTAELDLGDAVKGKVKHMIVRMNSFDVLDDHTEQQREVINVRERPRKRSVSEKIALFEKKLVTVEMDSNLETVRAIHINEKPSVQIINSVPTKNAGLEEECSANIRELSRAKMAYGSVANMTYIELSDGHKMPVLALGTALLDPRLAKHIVMAAIDLGYRAIDTAFIYGTEEAVGEGIRAKIQDGTVKREDLFIMSKLWSTFHAPDLVEGACRASLRAMGLEYFDLFMIHNPMSLKEGSDPLPKIAGVLQYSSHDYLDAWFAVEELAGRGLARSVGVSNFNSAQVARVLEKGRVKPVVNQVECHPYLTQQLLADFCEARGVSLSCYGVLGSKGTPAEYRGAREAAIDDPMVQVMAAGLGISPAQLLIKYQVKCGRSVVVKGSSAAHLWDNLGALRAPLDDVQVAALHALNKNRRTFTFKGMGDTHKNYPFNILF